MVYNKNMSVNFTDQIFGVLADGKEVHLYTVSHGNLTFSATNYGACLTSLIVPDKNNRKDDIIVGHATLQGYIANWMCHGAIVGRYANRISNASFKIDDNEYFLNKNGENGSCLHGGYDSYARKLWDCKTFSDSTGSGLIFSRTSYDGEQGFPGNLEIQVIYSITDKNSFSMRICAKTDKKTHVNLINHSYYNLKGIQTCCIDDLLVKIHSDKLVETDSNNLPTGKILNIKDTNFDFTDFRNISEAIKINEKNFDNCYYFENNDSITPVAEVLDQVSGRGMKVISNQVGLQLYTPIYERPFFGQYGIPAFGNGALCLETQALPDSPNQPNFPSTLLLPNQLYESITNLDFFC